MTPSRISMTQPQFEKLSKIIYDRSGIHFPEAKKYILESRLSHRLGELELENFDQYIALLSMGPYQQDEFQEMFNRITINETSFFRNDAQLDVFEKQVLPELLEARARTKRLRIWSAACSTGDEPYTLAIQLHRTLGVRMSDWTIEILGTDISERALNIASEGKYTSYSIRTTPKTVLDRYFTTDGRNFTLSEDIRRMVTFEKHNLKDRLAAKRHGTWDIIFCRNVLIYFDDDMKRQVINTFCDVLAPDGTLFIGHSERIKDITDRFEQIPVPQGFCYRKLAAPMKLAA
ncbi:MAG: protein-glutamate O-methyltransferase [Phycisphaerales bacterium]|nr:protein-glutamate O-methyltransferase [Planctomycetota bacterium]MCH8507539.1 protein-glutamate O-methyltransferase [Phycisphaerales bacterium]